MAGRPDLQLLIAVALLFSWASGLKDIRLSFCKSRWYNPSLVEYNNRFISAAKYTTFKNSNGKTWWINSLYMCGGDKPDVQRLSCKPFYPWKSQFTECIYTSRVRKGKLDNTGLGDVKVWTWPGKGVYAIFGRKPPRDKVNATCNDLVVYHQWLAQVLPDQAQDPASDPWAIADRDPLALHLPSSHTYPKEAVYVMEKNWMPFVYKDPATNTDRLFVTYLVMPHVVMELSPNGTATHRWTTSNHKLFEPFATFDVHGGPPVVYVPAQHSSTGQPYYLGIMHHIERFDAGRVRLYRHFAFRHEPHPPFAITAISDELPLTFNAQSRAAYVAFVSGLFLSDAGEVTITYGSADIECRAMIMGIRELDGFFTGKAAFREHAAISPNAQHAPALLGLRRLLAAGEPGAGEYPLSRYAGGGDTQVAGEGGKGLGALEAGEGQVQSQQGGQVQGPWSLRL